MFEDTVYDTFFAFGKLPYWDISGKQSALVTVIINTSLPEVETSTNN